jgi:nucleoside-diphosphate-sugar epimerase
LVTGATGCIGRHVLPLLAARGDEVHAVSSKAPTDVGGAEEVGAITAPASGRAAASAGATPQTASAGLAGSAREAGAAPRSGAVSWHQVDLLAPGAAAALAREVRATHLLHLAWYIAPGKWAAARENYAWVEASLTLVRAFYESGGTRFVGAGSCLEYDWRYGYCTEGLTPHTPHTFYGACKHALQTLVSGYVSVAPPAAASAASDAARISAAWGRVFFLYGPHEHPERLVAAVARALVQGEPAKTSHGQQVRDYLHVQDVAEAFVALLDSDLSGPVNIASGQAVTLRHIVERLGALAGRPDLLRIGAIPAAPTDTPLVVADVARLSRDLGWRPRIGLDEGLAQTLEWWRARR